MGKTKHKRLLAIILAIVLAIPNSFVFAGTYSSPDGFEVYPQKPDQTLAIDNDVVGLGIFGTDATSFDYQSADIQIDLNGSDHFDLSVVTEGAYKMVLFADQINGDYNFDSPPVDINVSATDVDVHTIDLVAPLGAVDIYDVNSQLIVGNTMYDIHDDMDNWVLGLDFTGSTFYVPPLPDGDYTIDFMPENVYIGGTYNLHINNSGDPKFTIDPEIVFNYPSVAFRFVDDGSGALNPYDLTFIDEADTSYNSKMTDEFFYIYDVDASSPPIMFHVEGNQDTNGFPINSKVVDVAYSNGDILVNDGIYDGSPIDIPMRSSNNIFQLVDTSDQPLQGIYEVVFNDGQDYPVYVLKTTNTGEFGLYLDPAMDFGVNVTEDPNIGTNKATGIPFSYDGTPSNDHVIVVDFANQGGPTPTAERYLILDAQYTNGSQLDYYMGSANLHILNDDLSENSTLVTSGGSVTIDGNNLTDGLYFYYGEANTELKDLGLFDSRLGIFDVSGGAIKVISDLPLQFTDVNYPLAVIFTAPDGKLYGDNYMNLHNLTGTLPMVEVIGESFVSTLFNAADDEYALYGVSTGPDQLSATKPLFFKVSGGAFTYMDNNPLPKFIKIPMEQGQLMTQVLYEDTMQPADAKVEVWNDTNFYTQFDVKQNGNVYSYVLDEGLYGFQAIPENSDVYELSGEDSMTVDSVGNITGVPTQILLLRTVSGAAGQISGDVKLEYDPNWVSLVSGATASIILEDIASPTVVDTQVITNGAFEFKVVSDGAYFLRVNLTNQDYLDYGFNPYLTNPFTVSSGVVSPSYMTFNFFDEQHISGGVITFNIFDDLSNPYGNYSFFVKELNNDSYSSKSTGVDNKETFDEITDGQYAILFSSTGADTLGQSDKYEFSIVSGAAFDINGLNPITTPIDISINQGTLLCPVYYPGQVLAVSGGAVEIFDDQYDIVLRARIKHDGNVFVSNLPEGTYSAVAIPDGSAQGMIPSEEKTFTVDASGNISGIDRLDMQMPQVVFNFFKMVDQNPVPIDMEPVMLNIVDEFYDYVGAYYTMDGVRAVGNLVDGSYFAKISPQDTLSASYTDSDWIPFVVSGGAAVPAAINLSLKPMGNPIFTLDFTNPDSSPFTGEVSVIIEGDSYSNNLVDGMDGNTYQIYNVDNGQYNIMAYSREADTFGSTENLPIIVSGGAVYIDSVMQSSYSVSFLEGHHFADVTLPDTSHDGNNTEITIKGMNESHNFYRAFVKKDKSVYLGDLIPGMYEFNIEYYGKDHNWVNSNYYEFEVLENNVISGAPFMIELYEPQVQVKGILEDTQQETQFINIDLLDLDYNFVGTGTYGTNGINLGGLDIGDYFIKVRLNDDLVGQGYIEPMEEPLTITGPATTVPIMKNIVIPKLNQQLEAHIKYNYMDSVATLDHMGEVEVVDTLTNQVRSFRVLAGTAKIGNLPDGEYELRGFFYSDWDLADQFMPSEPVIITISGGSSSMSVVDLMLRSNVDIFKITVNDDMGPFVGALRDRWIGDGDNPKLSFDIKGNEVKLLDATDGEYMVRIFSDENDDLAPSDSIFMKVSGGAVYIGTQAVTSSAVTLEHGSLLTTMTVPQGMTVDFTQEEFFLDFANAEGYLLDSFSPKPNGEVYYNSITNGAVQMIAGYKGDLPLLGVMKYPVSFDNQGLLLQGPEFVDFKSPQATVQVNLSDMQSPIPYGYHVILLDDADQEIDHFDGDEGNITIGNLEEGMTYKLIAMPKEIWGMQGYYKSEPYTFTFDSLSVPYDIMLTLQKLNVQFEARLKYSIDTQNYTVVSQAAVEIIADDMSTVGEFEVFAGKAKIGNLPDGDYDVIGHIFDKSPLFEMYRNTNIGKINISGGAASISVLDLQLKPYKEMATFNILDQGQPYMGDLRVDIKPVNKVPDQSIINDFEIVNNSIKLTDSLDGTYKLRVFAVSSDQLSYTEPKEFVVSGGAVYIDSLPVTAPVDLELQAGNKLLDVNVPGMLAEAANVTLDLVNKDLDIHETLNAKVNGEVYFSNLVEGDYEVYANYYGKEGTWINNATHIIHIGPNNEVFPTGTIIDLMEPTMQAVVQLSDDTLGTNQNRGMIRVKNIDTYMEFSVESINGFFYFAGLDDGTYDLIAYPDDYLASQGYVHSDVQTIQISAGASTITLMPFVLDKRPSILVFEVSDNNNNPMDMFHLDMHDKDADFMKPYKDDMMPQVETFVVTEPLFDFMHIGNRVYVINAPDGDYSVVAVAEKSDILSNSVPFDIKIVSGAAFTPTMSPIAGPISVSIKPTQFQVAVKDITDANNEKSLVVIRNIQGDVVYANEEAAGELINIGPMMPGSYYMMAIDVDTFGNMPSKPFFIEYNSSSVANQTGVVNLLLTNDTYFGSVVVIDDQLQETTETTGVLVKLFKDNILPLYAESVDVGSYSLGELPDGNYRLETVIGTELSMMGYLKPASVLFTVQGGQLTEPLPKIIIAKEGYSSVDLTNLNQLINKIDTLDLSGMEASGATELQTLLADAKALVASQSPLQADIDDMFVDLQTAIAMDGLLNIVEPQYQLSTTEFTNQPVTLTLTGPSMVYTVKVSINGNTPIIYNGPITLNHNGFVNYWVEYDQYVSEPTNVEIQNIDKELPIIYLNGPENIYLNVGDTYEEFDANVFDKDPNVQLEILNGNISTVTPGAYVVTYRATDSAGNMAERIRNVYVKDNLGPVITTNLPDEDVIEVVGSKLLLNFTATDNTDPNPMKEVRINGNLVQPVSGSSYQLQLMDGYNVVAVSAEDKDHNKSFKAYYAIKKRIIIKPSNTLLTNQPVILNLDSNIMPTDLIDKITVSYSLDGTNWLILDKVNGLQITENKTVQFKAKIDGLTEYGTPMIFNVINIDSTEPDAPEATVLNTEITNQNVLILFNSQEKIEVRVDGGQWNPTDGSLVVEQNGTVEARSKDAAGNVSAITTVVITNIDKSSPVISGESLLINDSPVNPANVNNAKIGDVIKVQFTVSGGAGFVRLNEKEPVKITGPTVDLTLLPFQFSKTNNKVVIWGQDEAGNISDKILLTNTLNVDVKAPEIKLLGGDMIMEVNGENLTLPGYIAFDDMDGEITDNVVTGGAFDMSVLGNYTITYDVNDSAGNPATQRQRNISIVDTRQPEIITDLTDKSVSQEQLTFDVTIQDNYDTNITELVTLNDQPVSLSGGSYTVTLIEGLNTIKISAADSSDNIIEKSFAVSYKKPESDKPVIIPSITSPTNKDVEIEILGPNGSEIQYSLNNTVNWQAYTQSLNFTQNGTLYARSRANAQSAWSQVVSYSISNIDKVPPVTPLITLSTNLKTNQSITATVTAEGQPQVQPLVLVNGKVYTYEGPFAVSENVSITVIVNDAAGNTSTATKNVTNIDKEAPIGTVLLSTQDPTSRDVFATLIVNEDFEMLTGERYYRFTENGTHTFSFRDLAGNTGSVDVTVTNIDKEKPVVSNIGYTVNQQTRTYAKGGDIVEVSFEVSEAVTGKIYVDSKVYTFESSVENGKHMVHKSIQVASDYTGFMNAFSRIVDSSGNGIIQGLITDLRVDNTKPALDVGISYDTIKGKNGYIIGDTLKLQVLTDGTQAYYGLSEVGITSPAAANVIVDDVFSDGEEYTFYFKAVDPSGNESDVKELSFKWDKGKPNAPTLDQSDSLTNSSKVTFTGQADAGYVRVSKTYKGNTIRLGEYEAYELAEGLDFGLLNGQNQFNFRSIDLAGNISSPSSVTITLDNREPLVNITQNDTTGDYDITANEPITVLGYTINGGTFIATSATTVLATEFASGDNILVVKAQDTAGNIGYGRFTFVNIVANEPIVNKQLSDGVTLTQGTFEDDTELHVQSLTETGGEEIQPDGNNEFISEPLDFSTTNNVGFVDPILIDLDLGLGHPENTKLYYLDDQGVWHSLDRSAEDGDSFYNATTSAATRYNVNGMFETSGTQEQAISVLPGHLVALLRHFSEYAAQADTTPPVLNLTSPSDQDKVSGGAVTIVGTVNEASTVSIYKNSVKQVDLANSNGTFQSNITLDQGTNTIEIRAVDSSSNASTSNPSIVLYYDSIAPVVSHTQTITNTKTSAYTITATVTETNAVNTSIYVNGSVATTTTSKNISYITSLNEGTNTYQFVSVDEYGNTFTSSTYNVVLDTTGPVITITGVTDNDVSTSDVTVGVSLDESGSWTASYNDGVTTTNITNGQSFTIPATSGQSVNYSLTVDGTDSLGNASTKTISFTIDKSAPTITVTGNPSGTYTNSDVTLNVSVAPVSATSTAKLYKDTVRQNDVNGSVTLTDEGAYKLEVDALNNGVVGLKTINFTIDKTDPTITVSGVTNGQTYTSQVTVTYSLSDSSGLASQTVTYSKDQGASSALSSGTVINANGSYVITANATDNAGNSSSKTVSFTVNIPTSTGGSTSGSTSDREPSSSGGAAPSTTVPSTTPVQDTITDFSKLIDIPKELTNISIAVSSDVKDVPKDFKIEVEQADQILKVKVVGSFIGTKSSVVGEPIKITSNKTEVKVPIEVKLPVVKEEIKNVEKVTIRVLDETTGKWKILPGKVDISNGVATTNTSTYGTFALVEGDKTFKDLKEASWAQNAVEVMASRDVINGYSEDDFKPNADITRAEFATIIVKALALDKGSKQVSFSDTKGLWYEEAIDIAASNGIMSGFDGKASPDQKITREQMAVMIINAFKLSGQLPEGTNSDAFADKSQMSSWAVDQIGAAAELGIITGKGDGGFYPADVATRAEATTMIYRLLKALGVI